jgi:hypothetical protein
MSRYKINNLEEYFKEYKKSVREPKFWDKLLPKTSPGTKNGKKWLISIWLKPI